MNSAKNKISKNEISCCDYNQHDDCVLENVVLNDSNKLKSITINLFKNKKQWGKCEFLKDDESFNKLLNLLELGGFVNILTAGSVPSRIKKYIELNKNFKHTEYCANNNFSAIFSKENPYTIYYYYSNINVKNELLTKVLHILISLRLHRVLWKIYAENTYIVMKKMK